MSFALYIVGFIVLIVGLAWGAHLAHVPPHWIGVGAVVLVGLGVVKAVGHTASGTRISVQRRGSSDTLRGRAHA